VAACALLTFGAVSFAADNYPSRSIRVIMPFAAGGAVDARQKYDPHVALL
jgi:tripartite-type tricarboxylate transporter receptor subunit TctC